MTAVIMNIPRSQLSGIQRQYCCAACWNSLNVRFDNSMTGDECSVDCGTEGCPLPGFVTQHFVERRLAVSRSEALEARLILGKSAECGWLKFPTRSAGAVLAELGF